jgi:hypothetical protein
MLAGRGPRADTSAEALAKSSRCSTPRYHRGQFVANQSGAAAALVCPNGEALGLKPFALRQFRHGRRPRSWASNCRAIRRRWRWPASSWEHRRDRVERSLRSRRWRLRARPASTWRSEFERRRVARSAILGCGPSATRHFARWKAQIKYGMVTMCVGGGQGAAGIREDLEMERQQRFPTQDQRRRVPDRGAHSARNLHPRGLDRRAPGDRAHRR